MRNEMDRVVPLDELSDYKVAEGDPDVRGWEVVASDGRKVGEVDQLLVDTGARKVRYLDVDVEDGLIEGARDRHLLVPIGYARLDRDDDRILVDDLRVEQFAAIPAYEHQPLTRDYETSLLTAWERDRTETGAADDFYAGRSFDDDRFYAGRRTGDEARVTRSEEELAVGTREVRAGEVDVEKRVETEHVEKRVPTSHEEVVVERRPATPGMSAEPRISGDEVRIPVNEEEVVAEKRVVPKEELVVKKREVRDEETVEADLRREEVDVRTEGDVRMREPRDER